MATEILAAGTTAAQSEPIELAAGESEVIGIKAAAGGARLIVQVLVAAATWQRIGMLEPGDDAGVKLVYGPGSYRVSRPVGPSCGAFKGS